MAMDQNPYAPPRPEGEDRKARQIDWKKNPLSAVCPGLLVLSCLATIYEVSQGKVRVGDMITTVTVVVLFVLYRRRSRHAATFLLWTTVPVYPVYMGLLSLGVVGQPPTRLALVILTPLWLGLVIYLRRLRSKYATYLEASSSPVRPEPTA